VGSYSDEKFFLRNILNKIAVKETIINPKITIIVYTLNSEQNISNCLLSLVKQSLKEIEIIVIDKGSTDDTYNLLAIFEQIDSRFKVIRQDYTSTNTAKTKNINLEISKGEYISFINPKCSIHEKIYEKLYTAAIKNKSNTISKLFFHNSEYNKFPQLLNIKLIKNIKNINKNNIGL
jgi:glycosyltransferase involved in cell wall biosynthesis